MEPVVSDREKTKGLILDPSSRQIVVKDASIQNVIFSQVRRPCCVFSLFCAWIKVELSSSFVDAVSCSPVPMQKLGAIQGSVTCLSPVSCSQGEAQLFSAESKKPLAVQEIVKGTAVFCCAALFFSPSCCFAVRDMTVCPHLCVLSSPLPLYVCSFGVSCPRSVPL